jgi:hypothetical protein
MRDILGLFRWGLLLIVNPKAAWADVERAVEEGKMR